MNSRDDLNRLLGAREEQLLSLKKQLISAESSKSNAQEWTRLQSHQRDLADWLVDQATDADGHVVISIIDAELGGEDFVPGCFRACIQGRRYQFDLVSTCYMIQELDPS